jgi:HPt (histidine-containing phosphotransfer) domain-containing protein
MMLAMSVAARESSPPANSATRSGEPALDLVHLARQTDGDLELQQELLALFDRQSASLLAQSSDASVAQRRRADAAHKLRGSALAIGAGAVARAAATLEAALGDAASAPAATEAALATLAQAVEAARAALARLRG